jgi:hypothetical protein
LPPLSWLCGCGKKATCLLFGDYRVVEASIIFEIFLYLAKTCLSFLDLEEKPNRTQHEDEGDEVEELGNAFRDGVYFVILASNFILHRLVHFAVNWAKSHSTPINDDLQKGHVDQNVKSHVIQDVRVIIRRFHLLVLLLKKLGSRCLLVALKATVWDHQLRHDEEKDTKTHLEWDVIVILVFHVGVFEGLAVAWDYQFADEHLGDHDQADPEKPRMDLQTDKRIDQGSCKWHDSIETEKIPTHTHKKQRDASKVFGHFEL